MFYFTFKGGYAANAAGISISSLEKVTDVKSNKANINLLQYLTKQMEDTDLESLVEELKIVEEAERYEKIIYIDLLQSFSCLLNT